MAQKPNRRRAAKDTPVEATSDLGFGKRNAVLFGAGLLCIGVGYALLAQGSITAAPILLVLGYVVLMLLAIVL